MESNSVAGIDFSSIGLPFLPTLAHATPALRPLLCEWIGTGDNLPKRQLQQVAQQGAFEYRQRCRRDMLVSPLLATPSSLGLDMTLRMGITRRLRGTVPVAPRGLVMTGADRDRLLSRGRRIPTARIPRPVPLFGRARRRSRACFVLAGTGKSSVCHFCSDRPHAPAGTVLSSFPRESLSQPLAR